MSILTTIGDIGGYINNKEYGKDALTAAEKLLLNTVFPDSFEYYLIALEVIDSDNVPVERFSFTVLPSSIRRSETKIKTIQKTMGGVVTTFNTTFVPYQISLSGSFGRKLKVSLGLDTPQMLRYNPPQNLNGLAKTSFKRVQQISNTVNTGFGYTKKLEQIFDYGTAVDKKGNPYKIILYNMAYNEVVFVEMDNLVTEINDRERNMMWGYNLNMTAVSPVTSVSLDTVKDKVFTTDGQLRNAAVDKVIFL